MLSFDLESPSSVTAGNTVKVKANLSNFGTLKSSSGEVVVKAPESWNVKPIQVAFEGVEPGNRKQLRQIYLSLLMKLLISIPLKRR